MIVDRNRLLQDGKRHACLVDEAHGPGRTADESDVDLFVFEHGRVVQVDDDASLSLSFRDIQEAGPAQPVIARDQGARVGEF